MDFNAIEGARYNTKKELRPSTTIKFPFPKIAIFSMHKLKRGDRLATKNKQELVKIGRKTKKIMVSSCDWVF